jgi:hypothetical protein
MGQCQSQSSGEFAPGNGVHGARSFNIKTGNSATAPGKSRSATPRKSGGRLDRLLILIPGVKSSSKAETGFPFSPSEQSGVTQPLTPGSLLESPSTSSPPRQKLESLAEEDDDDSGGFPSLMNGSSLRYSDDIMEAGVMDTVITEEESLGAPSDEEDFHEVQQEQQQQEQESQEDEKSYQSLQSFPDDESLVLSKEKSVTDLIPGSTQRSAPGSNSSLRKSQTRVKLLHKRITTPESINFHKPSLVAPPKGSATDPLGSTSSKTSVNRHTIADFNKLKIQVKLATRAEKHKSRKAKLEDRLGDVKGYRNLWSEYEEIEQRVKESSDTEGPASATAKKHTRNKSLDLKQPNTWYFDFQQLDPTKDDNKTKESMSLLSEVSMEAQCRLYKEKRRERRQKSKSKSKNKKEPRVIFSDDRSVSSSRSTTSVKSFKSFNGQTAENDYGPPMGLASIEVPYYSSGEDTPKAKSQSRRGRSESDDFSLTSAYTANDDRTVCSEDEGGNDYGVQRRRPPKTYQDSDDFSISTFGDRSIDSSYGGSRSHRGGEAAFDLNNDFAPRIRDAPMAMEVKNTTINVVNKKQSSRDTKKKMTEVKKRPSPTPLDKYGFDPAAPLFSQLDMLTTLPSVEIDDALTGKLRWRQFSKEEQSRVDGANPARCLDAIFGKYQSGEPVAKATRESVSGKEPESETTTNKEPELKEVDLNLVAEPQVEETAGSLSVSQELVQKEEACDSIPEAESKALESDANVSISRNPIIFEEKKEPQGKSPAVKMPVERKQTHDFVLPKDPPMEQENIKNPLPTVSSEEDRQSEGEDEKPVVPEAIEVEEVSAFVPEVSKVTKDCAIVVSVDGDSVNAEAMEEARTQPESVMEVPTQPESPEGKVDTKGFGLYDPLLANLTAEQFLLLASAEKYVPDDNEDEEQTENDGIDESQQRKSASKFDIRNTRERAEIRRQSRTSKPYNPVIAGMSTDDFLRISHTMDNFIPDFESPERPPLRLEDGDIPPEKLAFAFDDEESTDSLTQNDQIPSSESSKDTSDVCTELTTCTASPSESIFGGTPASRVPEYVDGSEELAVNVTDKIDRLLSKYRKSSISGDMPGSRR